MKNLNLCQLIWMCLVGMLVAGCVKAPPSRLAEAGTQASAIGERVLDAQEKVTQRADAILSQTAQGESKTPAAAIPLLAPVWQAIRMHATYLLGVGDGLGKIKGDVDNLREKVLDGERERQQLANQLVQSEKHAKAEAEAHAKELAAVKTAIQRDMRLIRLALFGVIVAGVALGVWLKDFRLSVAAGIGGAVGIALTLFTGWMDEYKLWFVWGFAGLCVLALGWFIFDWYKRGDFWKALATDPIQDVKDWMGKQAEVK